MSLKSPGDRIAVFIAKYARGKAIPEYLPSCRAVLIYLLDLSSRGSRSLLRETPWNISRFLSDSKISTISLNVLPLSRENDRHMTLILSRSHDTDRVALLHALVS